MRCGLRGSIRRAWLAFVAAAVVALCLPASAPTRDEPKKDAPDKPGARAPEPGEEKPGPGAAEKWTVEALEKWKELQPLVKKLTDKIQKEAKGPKWQYAVLPVESMDAYGLAAKMNEMGSKGWECFSSVGLREGGPVLLFRKREGGALSGGVTSELIELLLFRLLIPEVGG